MPETGRTTNLPYGVTNSFEVAALGNLPIPDPTRVHLFVDDFDAWLAGAGEDWATTIVGTGTAVVNDADGGILAVVNSAADDDSFAAQWQGSQASVTETYLFETGRELWFKTRFSLDDVTESDLGIGLAITTGTHLTPSDGVFFRKDDGAATVNLVVVKDSVETEVEVGTLVDDTFVELAFHYNGLDAVDAFIDDMRVARADVANLPDDEELAVTFVTRNGQAVALTMLLDYILVAKAR